MKRCSNPNCESSASFCAARFPPALLTRPFVLEQMTGELNEGITTIPTKRQFSEISPEKGQEAERQQIYGHAVDLTTSLENIAGESAAKDAYYGSNIHELENKADEILRKERCADD